MGAVFTAILLILFFLWYAGVLTTIWEVLMTATGLGLSWIFNPKLAVGFVVDQLSYRDFWVENDIIETKSHIYAAVELVPIPSDGNDAFDWNNLYRQLNVLFTNLPTDTIVHFDCNICTDDLGAMSVLERLKTNAGDTNLKLIAEARAFHLMQMIESGKLKNTKVYCCIGRPLKNNPFKVSFKGLFYPEEFLEREYVPFKSLTEEVLRTRNTFLSTYKAFGGKGRTVNPQEIYEHIFNKMNPAIAEKIRPRKFAVPELERFYEIKQKSIPCATMFADSPRESLGLSEIEFNKEYFEIDSVPHLCLSLNTLPSSSTLGMIERLTRVAGFDFPINFSVTIQLEDQAKWEKQLATIYKYLDEDLRVGSDAATRLQKELKIQDIEDFRTRLRVANDKICLFGFNLMFNAPDVEELRRRRDAILAFLPELEGLQLLYERHLPLGQVLQLFPCEDVTKDCHRKPNLVRAALGLTPVTGGNPGVDLEETTSIFTRADGGIFRWNPQSKMFASGMTLCVGRPGTGKSVLLNRFRTDALLEGRHLVTVDFDVSGESLVDMQGGRVINFRNGGVGFFDIRPKPGEDLGDDQLDENGIPKGRYQEVCVLLEKLCLPPSSAMTDDLPPAYATFIRERVYQTYQTFRNRIPKMDDFLANFEKCRSEEKEMSHSIIQNLQKFTMSGFLGDLLNTEEEAVRPTGEYTVFDFRLVQDDPQLRFVATLMVKMFVNRFLAQDKKILKYFDVDEVQVIAQDPLMAALFSLIFLTARKRGCYCVAASQSPHHFMSPQLRDLRESSEVFWMLPIKDARSAQEAFKLTDGVAELVEHVSREGVGIDYRDIVVSYPGGTAHLRHRMNPLDLRLLAQRGKTLHDKGNTLEFIKAVQILSNPTLKDPVLTPEMVKALKLDEN